MIADHVTGTGAVHRCSCCRAFRQKTYPHSLPGSTEVINYSLIDGMLQCHHMAVAAQNVEGVQAAGLAFKQVGENSHEQHTRCGLHTGHSCAISQQQGHVPVDLYGK